ncbi:MAG: UvrD-helicase domain-containing protein [Alphaproteobacteria bacterium]|nr:UvrD-helicase domain-containing protein [Alphaproteobacteria bacterium]
MSDIFDFEEESTKEVKKEEPSYIRSLNPEQKEAVLTTEGPVLVLSGAGTGKTRVLTTRLAHIIDSRKAHPWQCLAVTFTNKAAREMQERLDKMIGPDSMSVWLGTFHRIGLRILRAHYQIVGLDKNFVILGEDDQERLLKQLMQERQVDIKQWTPKALLNIIQHWKDRGLSPSMVTDREDTDFLNGEALFYYRLYQDKLKSLNATDFGDLLLLPLEIFKTRPDIASFYQKQFKYILVDEYQDTNVAQYLWLRLLARGSGNLCCVGDDDQSIYSWRGAEVENILRFEKDYKDAKVIRLESNYRSTKAILGTASALIAHNEDRLGKSLRVAPGRDGSGEPVHVTGYWSGGEEATKVVEKIEDCQREGVPLSETAVLVRAGFQTREFEEALRKAGMPYQIIGDFKFYEREEIKDAVAYLRLLANSNDDLAFSRIVNKPKRGVGPAAMETLSTYASQNGTSLLSAILGAELKPSVRKTLEVFYENILRWRELLIELPLAKVTEQMLEESGYYQMWRTDKSPEAEGRLENLKELQSVMREDLSDLSTFIEHASLVSETDKIETDDMVTVMTLHASKGLEFDVVFLPGWEEGLFPHARSVDEGGLEEERRLAYVGITRARKKAFISFASNRRVYGGWQNALPSRFVDELPEEHIVFDSMRGLKAKTGWDAKTDFDYEKPSWRKPSYQSYREEEDDWDTGNNYVWGQSMGMFESSPQKSKKLGKRVLHSTFGYGTIIKEEGDKLEISFDRAGRKKVLARFVTEL